MRAYQTPVIILPHVAPLGTETEAIADAVTHVSLEVDTAFFQEKRVSLVAIEGVLAGAAGNLLWWVELAVARTTTSPLYWVAIGGGGGALAGSAGLPVATTPNVLVGTGVNGARQNDQIFWTAHAQYARVVVQTPVPAAFAAWGVQALFEGLG